MANLPMGNHAGNQPQMVHAGLNCELLRISASVSLSGADVQLIGKLPHGAIPVQAIYYPASQVVAKFGISSSQEMFFGSATYSIGTVSTRRLGFAMQVSLSDDVGQRHENIVGVFTGGASLGYIGDLAVFYRMPGQDY
jgi:hypothetical protein